MAVVFSNKFCKLEIPKTNEMKTSIKIIAVLFASQIFLCSCPKNTECKAVVTCKDQNGNAVKGSDFIL